MGKCRLSPKHHRVRKKGDGHFSGNNHKIGIRGHKWSGKGKDRVCERCGKRPVGYTGLPGRSDPTYDNKNRRTGSQEKARVRRIAATEKLLGKARYSR